MKDVEWKREWFRKSTKYWKESTNQTKFLAHLAKKLNVQKEEDWELIRRSQLISNGASSLLNEYGGSFGQVLSNIYKGIECEE